MSNDISLEQYRDRLQARNSVLASTIAALEMELEEVRRHNSYLRKKAEDLLREREAHFRDVHQPAIRLLALPEEELPEMGQPEFKQW